MSQELAHPDEPLGLRLRIARMRIGLKQYELAAKVGITSTVLSQIETGLKEPNPDLLQRIQAALEIQSEAVA